jgi:translation initiation factor 6
MELDINVGIVNDKVNALGNLILANDNGGIVSPSLSKKGIKDIEDILDIDVEKRKISGFKTVGSVGVATNKGALIHPLVKEKELEWIESVLKVEADIGTVNRGTGFVRTGIVANSKGVLVGEETTGPEIMRIEDSLGLLG